MGDKRFDKSVPSCKAVTGRAGKDCAEAHSQKLLYTEKDVCEMLSLSRAGVLRAMANGLLAGVKIGRSRRFTAQELQRLISSL